MQNLSRIRQIQTTTAAMFFGTALAFAACASDDAADPARSTTTVHNIAATTTAGDITVTGAWARTSPAMTSAGALYLELTNGADTDDVITGASIDPSIAASAQLHNVVMANDDAGSGAAMMEMVHVDEIALPAGQTVALKPGSFHIMLMELAAPLVTGNTFDARLTLATAGEVVVKVEIRDDAP